jgi:hypothetical protein
MVFSEHLHAQGKEPFLCTHSKEGCVGPIECLRWEKKEKSLPLLGIEPQ